MSDSLPTVIDLLTRTDFLVGAFFGLAGLVVLFFAPRTENSAGLGWGLTLTSAAFIAVSLAIGARLMLLAALAALALGGWMSRPPSGSARAPFGWALIALGAVSMIWRGGFPEIGWLLVLAPMAIVLIGSTLAAWSTRLPQEALGIMFAITAFGIWVTVPETEGARALLGASLPMGLATLRPIGAKLGYAGAFALAGLMVWVVATGGEARSASIIGGWACIGAFAILPHYNPPPERLVARRPVVIVLFHGLLVLAASRLVGLWESGGLALIAVIAGGLGVFFCVGLLPSIRRGRQSQIKERSDPV